MAYRTVASAREAIRQFDGANAAGQPIALTLMPPGPVESRSDRMHNERAKDPFQRASMPGPSLFDRVEDPDRRRRRSRSRSPLNRRGRPHRSDVDRYVPGHDRRRRNESASPPRRRQSPRREVRKSGKNVESRQSTARPKKTQEELDQEMDEYWKGRPDGATTHVAVSAPVDEDVDMAG